jgi:hypothetical protein
MAATEGSYEDSTAARRAATGPALRGPRPAWLGSPQAYTSETKPFYLTSEFLVYVLFVMGLGISAATDATIDAWRFWMLATIATAAYVLSRGIAKAASRSRARDPREDVDLGRDR